MTTYKLHSIAALSLAILFGIYVANGHEISYLVFVPNLIGLVIGGLLIGFSDLAPRFTLANFIHKNYQNLAFIFATLLLLTLFGSGIDGVHRWIRMGPLQINVSLALTPLMIYAILRLEKYLALGLLVEATIIYILQPDAGQATAFAAACSTVLVFRKDFSTVTKATGISIVGFGVAGAWFRSDPLMPVVHVEEILQLAYSWNLMAFALMILTILFLFSPLIVAFIKSRDNQTTLLIASFFTFWMLNFAVTEIGHFPVPVIGAGAAGVVGWSLSFLFVHVSNIQHQMLARNFNADRYSKT